MKKRLGSILILMMFICVMLFGYERAQGQEAVYHAEEKELSKETQETAGGAKKQENVDLVEDQEVMEEADDAESLADIDNPAFEEYWAALPERQPRVLLKYGEEIFPAKYSDEVIDIAYTDDLSLLEKMEWTNHSYAYRDGTVYYRRYYAVPSEEENANEELDSTFEGEMFCIDQNGIDQVLFSDTGYGDFYLIGERFYMTEYRKSDEGWEEWIYSVDMEGSSRIDYGSGEILSADEKRNIVILKRYGEGSDKARDYCVLDCDTGVCDSLFAEKYDLQEEDEKWSFEAYQDGWVYLSVFNCNTKQTVLYAVSTEGIWQEVITLTSDAEDYYSEHIIQFEVLGDRLFFTYGGYYGRGIYSFFQGGRIITIKRDGTDYRAIEDILADAPTEEDYFYLRQDIGRTLLYYSADYYITDSQDEDYLVTVWDVDTGTLYPSTLLMYPVYSSKKGIFANTHNNVFAMPDRSGRVVKVLENLVDYIEIWRTEDGHEYQPDFEDFYYRDGYLYFTAEYGVWSDNIENGWGSESYHRMRMEGYRLKLGEDKAELLYAY